LLDLTVGEEKCALLDRRRHSPLSLYVDGLKLGAQAKRCSALQPIECYNPIAQPIQFVIRQQGKTGAHSS